MEKRKIIPKLREWIELFSGNSSSDTYIMQHYGIQDISIISFIFHPVFIEVEGLVYLSDQYLDSGAKKWFETFGNHIDVQKMTNHVHLDKYMQDSESESDEIYESFRELCKTIKICWAAALVDQFPNYTFVVNLYFDEEGIDPVITFWQI
jgi:hypothetical protein